MQERQNFAPPLPLPPTATYAADPGRPITDPSLDPAVQNLLAEAEHKLRVDFEERRDGAPAGPATEAPWHSRAYLEALEGQVALLEAVYVWARAQGYILPTVSCHLEGRVWNTITP